MKIIDLYNKIANGEDVPIEFIYNGYLWEYDVKNKMWFYYFVEGKNYRFDRLFYINQILNDEVEILEEEKKIPEKIPEEIIVGKKQPTHRIKKIEKKINEIIDYLESKEE